MGLEGQDSAALQPSPMNNLNPFHKPVTTKDGAGGLVAMVTGLGTAAGNADVGVVNGVVTEVS